MPLTLERRTEQTGFQLADTQYQIAAGLYNAVAYTDQPDSYRDTAFLYSAHMDMGIAVNRLLDQVTDEERKEIFSSVSDLAAQANEVGELFPADLREPAAKAYGELTTSILWSFVSLKLHGNKLPPQGMELRGGKKIGVGGFTYGEALHATRELHEAVKKISDVATDQSAPVTRVNDTGAYGMYRLGKNRDVLAAIRLKSGTSYDPAIEYANAKGTEASIGFSVDTGKDLPSPYKNEQANSFSIRIDNEGESLSLDVGSILGKQGTLGKRIADLIAIGDAERLKAGGTPEKAGLNHNKKYFPKHLAEPEVFARMAAGMAANYENRRQSTRAIRIGRQLLPAKTTGA